MSIQDLSKQCNLETLGRQTTIPTSNHTKKTHSPKRLAERFTEGQWPTGSSIFSLAANTQTDSCFQRHYWEPHRLRGKHSPSQRHVLGGSSCLASSACGARVSSQVPQEDYWMKSQQHVCLLISSQGAFQVALSTWNKTDNGNNQELKCRKGWEALLTAGETAMVWIKGHRSFSSLIHNR